MPEIRFSYPEKHVFTATDGFSVIVPFIVAGTILIFGWLDPRDDSFKRFRIIYLDLGQLTLRLLAGLLSLGSLRCKGSWRGVVLALVGLTLNWEPVFIAWVFKDFPGA